MKRNIKYIILISILSSQFFVLIAQKSKRDTIELKTVDINAEKLHHQTTGLKIETIDSLTLSHHLSSNLSEIISSQTTLYMKSYGLSGLADISIRGTAPEQNAVLWNGFNINVPNIGLSDLALIPGSFFNKVEILYGGSSSIFGNGIIGGSIHLENEPLFINKKSFNLNSSVGSFNTFNENLRVDISNAHLSSVTALTFNSAENNFPYSNNTRLNAPVEILGNSQTYNHGLLQQFSFLNSQSSIIDAAVWYQYANRNIPPTLTETAGSATQKDKSLRSTLQWKKTTENMSFIAKGAYFYNYEHYLDPMYPIDSKIFNNTGIIDLEFHKHSYCHTCEIAADSGRTNISSNSQNYVFDFNAGINYTLNEADINAYNGSKQRNDAALFASLYHNFKSINWSASINLRQQFTQGYAVPLNPSLGMNGKIWKFISGRLNISQNFRIPTLNELYWLPGGNPDLKPETSFNQEAGFIIKPFTENVSHFQKVKHLSEFSVTLFNSYMNNHIQWVPVNSAVSTPENIKEVRNHGAELKGNYTFSIFNLQLSINLAYSYTKSTNQKALSALDNSLGKQLIYVPTNTALASVSLNYKEFEINYSQNYIGKRYTTSDNSISIPYFTLGNIYISKQFNLNVSHLDKVKHFNLQFNINNLWNVPYEAIAYIPMPGRFYRLSINYKIN